MVARVNTVEFLGVDTKEVDVQVHMTQGIPGINIVGLADKAVAESKERIRAAFHSMGLAVPQKRITVNLAPADIHKEGSHYDLPIALGILIESDIIQQEEVTKYIALGELSLDGRINPIRGVLPAAISAHAKKQGVICPNVNGSEAVWSGNDNVIAPSNLLELINHFKNQQILSRPEKIVANENISYPDLRDIKGQKLAKRALEISAAGGHNLLMIGPPGSGKSMLAKRLPGLLPPLSTEEMLNVSMINSIAGQLKGGDIIRTRPFRDPHCSSSMPSIVGGGRDAKPGEVTLAHLGVLFLDELPEFNRNVLESLRQPLETGAITISRVNSHVTYPSRFQLVAAMNPCKCGYFGDVKNSCTKVPRCAQDYQSKISGPLLDRFDLRVDVPAISSWEMEHDEVSESSEIVAQRVAKARDIQLKRYENLGVSLNSYADGEVLNNVTKLDADSKDLLKNAQEKFGMSMRGYNRVLRVSRTIADLADSDVISSLHLAEALSFRIAKLKA